ncbi:hypothetical protein EYF80_012402 [Liparis tanakae]|uniref:Uncharacterized protein n=1 Tax=Liparis tanakae TaxID=230148 RepID=A0A4Z2IHH8_9TELE|nr:hypothetical protein EYF80_012402 [Liparis tanakae]
MQCDIEDAALVASVARSVCPFPDYNPSPLLSNMLSPNSSHYLRHHYMEVQSSLTSEQLEDFNWNLRTIFGERGNVTLGGVGVVALSLAVLFDTLARQAKGERVSDSGPIPGLFLKDLSGCYPPHANTASEYLRLVPHIANNPSRMREETERYLRQFLIDDNPGSSNGDIAGVNFVLGQLFQSGLRIHLLRIANSTVVDDIVRSALVLRQSQKKNKAPVENATTSGDVSRSRKRRIPAPEISVVFNLNCDPDAASDVFLAKVRASNNTREALKRCAPFNGYLPKTWLHYIARLAWLDVTNAPIFNLEHDRESLVAQRESFDLRAHAHRKWAEY